MRSIRSQKRSDLSDDRTTKARIRDAAIQCFVDFGVADTTARKVAAAAGVSPGLVMHHFGSMDGLRAACDEYVASAIRQRKEEVMAQGLGFDLVQALRETAYGNVIGYLARVLTDDSPAVSRLVDELVADAQDYMEQGVESGMLRPSDHPYERAAMITLWVLGGLVLHRHMTRLLGVDLTDPSIEGDPQMLRYVRPAMEVMGRGLYTEAFGDHIEAALAQGMEAE